MATANDVLAKARGELGYSRYTDPLQGSKYGRWYAQITGVPYYGTNGVPYCAMFVSWVFAQVGQGAPGLPGPYCPTMLNAGKAACRAVGKTTAHPGDIVYFDWGRDGVADHVGIVESNNGYYLTCIEGNTSPGTGGSQSNGGGVYRRTRAFGDVIGVVRPAYAQPAPSGLAVDGVLGAESTAELQRQLGTPADGIVSGQSASWRSRLAAWPSVRYGAGGSQCVAALQRKLGVTDDGYLGPGTISALQRKLGVTADGYLGPDTARALQRALNAGNVRRW